MKIIKPSATPMKHDGLTPYEFIEKVGRTCYKSEDKITTGSAEKFVNMIKKNKHGSVLEHGTVYLTIPFEEEFAEPNVFKLNTPKSFIKYLMHK